MNVPERLRKKRIWTVADFATFSGLSHKAARERLKRYDRALGGTLLTPSLGKNREYTFQPAYLARVVRETVRDGRLAEAIGLFDPVDALEMQVDALEDRVEEVHDRTRVLGAQTGQNTRDIAKLKKRRAA